MPSRVAAHLLRNTVAHTTEQRGGTGCFPCGVTKTAQVLVFSNIFELFSRNCEASIRGDVTSVISSVLLIQFLYAKPLGSQRESYGQRQFRWPPCRHSLIVEVSQRPDGPLPGPAVIRRISMSALLASTPWDHRVSKTVWIGSRNLTGHKSAACGLRRCRAYRM